MSENRKTDYALLCAQLRELLAEDPHYLPVLPNASALLMESLEEINWAGFYLLRDGRLVLGPFQGKPACIHIDLGRGVCGTAAAENRTVRVENVHDFPGHIACDSASNSEIVIPLRDHWGEMKGVLDIDSPKFGRFDAADEKGLEEFARELGSCKFDF